MYAYQTQYIENMKEIALLSDFYRIPADSFEKWHNAHLSARKKIRELRAVNTALLNDHLFPQLDALHSASEEDIQALNDFGDALVDWKTNLDTGIYCVIHDSLLSLYRMRKDRAGIIRELYKLGMGLFYQNRMVTGIDESRTREYIFRNEMVFTEAGSYLKFFEEIEDEETKGYIIRSLANIAICTTDRRKRVAVSARVLQIVLDPYYRALAPSLPWDVFLRRTHQQMSANRNTLSRGNMTTEELSAILESCQVVFEPEKENTEPNVRWLWPYYEMEYSCGFVDLPTTLDRMETLISTAESGGHESGLYAGVQLPVYYGRLLRDNPGLQDRPRRIRFLNNAYRAMMKTVLSMPAAEFDDYFFYCISLILTDYYETEGVESYRSVTEKLMQKLTGNVFIDAKMTGDIISILSERILNDEPDFFDDITFLRDITDPDDKKAALKTYAELCGLYHNFGLIKMNIGRLVQSRSLLESEFSIYRLHTYSGYDDLKARESTKMLADTALGHHAWYQGDNGYPDDYVRNDSQYRQMTDVTAAAVYILEHRDDDIAQTAADMITMGRNRFSPLVVACLSDQDVQDDIQAVLDEGGLKHYRTLFDELKRTD
ncbi:MAG: hypothetical protein IJ120_06825 [Solobacterium sp.]|nr:hypothetical protein [Solobacterium sp.]